MERPSSAFAEPFAPLRDALAGHAASMTNEAADLYNDSKRVGNFDSDLRQPVRMVAAALMMRRYFPELFETADPGFDRNDLFNLRHLLSGVIQDLKKPARVPDDDMDDDDVDEEVKEQEALAEAFYRLVNVAEVVAHTEDVNREDFLLPQEVIEQAAQYMQIKRDKLDVEDLYDLAEVADYAFALRVLGIPGKEPLLPDDCFEAVTTDLQEELAKKDALYFWVLSRLRLLDPGKSVPIDQLWGTLDEMNNKPDGWKMHLVYDMLVLSATKAGIDEDGKVVLSFIPDPGLSAGAAFPERPMV